MLRGISFAHQDEVVTLAQILEGLRHFRQNFDGMIGDLVSKAANALVQDWRDRIDGELLESFDERMCEAVQPVTVFEDRFPLHLVQYQPNRFG